MGYRRFQGVTGSYSGLQGVTRGSRQARSRDFLWGGAIKRGDGPNEAGGGGELVCLRLDFEHFKKLAIS